MNLSCAWRRLRGVARPLSGLPAAAVVIVVGAGCGIINPPDDPLEARLEQVRDEGRTALLADLTDLAWDEVHLFNEYTRKETIEKVVGSPVIGSDYHGAGSLLVFEDGGEVVRKVEVSGDYLRADEYTFPGDVLVTALGVNGLRLVPAEGTP